MIDMNCIFLVKLNAHMITIFSFLIVKEVEIKTNQI